MTAFCRISLIVLVVLPLGLVGCSDARLIRTDPNGGVVAIPRNTNTWPAYNRSAAEELMKQKCPQGYVIDSEREVEVGRRVEADSNGTVIRPVKEYQIAFHALGTPPPMSPTIVPASAVLTPKPQATPIPTTGLPPTPVPVAGQ
jgi:hypothetical protein